MVVYSMDLKRNSSAKNLFREFILNVHQQQRTRDVTEINALRRKRLITIQKYNPVFREEICSMMYTFGNCQEPLPESVYLVEKLLREQMNKLLCKATEASFLRRGCNITHEDVLFIIRKNRIVVKRLMQYLEIMDMKAVLYRRTKMNLDSAYPDRLPRGLRVKVCLAFLDYLDESGTLGSVLDEYVDDPVASERMLRRNKMTLRMGTEEYIKFSERLSASFLPGGHVAKFKNWLLEDNATSLIPTKLALEIINFLARETVAHIVDLSLEVKKEAFLDALSPAPNISKFMKESFEDTDGEDFQDINGEESDDTPAVDSMCLRSEAAQDNENEVTQSGIIDSDPSSGSATEDEGNEYDENSDTENSSDEGNPNKSSSDESSDELSDNHVTDDDDETESEDSSSDNEDAVDGKKITGNEDVSENEDMSDPENMSDNDEDMDDVENVPGNDEDSASSNEDIAGAENIPDNDEDLAGAENAPHNDEDNAFIDEYIADVENIPHNYQDNAFNYEYLAGAENVPDNDEDNTSSDEAIANAENIPDNDQDKIFNYEYLAGAENVPDNDEDSASNGEDIADAEDESGDENNESSGETASSTENSENSSYDEEGDSEEEEAVEENKESSDENEYRDSSDEKSEDTSEDSMNESEEDSTENSDLSQNNSKENYPEAKISDEDIDNKEESSCLLQKGNISGKEKLPEAEYFHKTSVVPESDEVCRKEDAHDLAKADYVFSRNEPGISDISDPEFPDTSQKLDVQYEQACDKWIEKNNIQEEIPVGTTLHKPSDLNIAATYEKPSTEFVSKSDFSTEDTEKASEFQVSSTKEFLYETLQDVEPQSHDHGEAQFVLVKRTDVGAMDEEEIQPNNPTYIPNASTATETCEEMEALQPDSSTEAFPATSEPSEEDTDSDPVSSPLTFYRKSIKPYPFKSSKFPTPVFSLDPEFEDASFVEDKQPEDLEPYELEPITPNDIEEALRRFNMPVQPSLFFKVNRRSKDVERFLFC